MPDTIPTTVFGLLTFIIIGLLAALRKLYSDNQTLQNKIEAIQGARLQDAKDNLDKFGQPLASISQTINLIYDKLKASKDEVS